MRDRPTFCCIDFKSICQLFILSSFGRKKRRRPSRYLSFLTGVGGWSFWNKTRTSKTHPIQQNARLCDCHATPFYEHLWCVFFCAWRIVVQKVGRFTSSVLDGTGRRGGSPPTVCGLSTNTEAFVGDPVQIQTEKSGSQRGFAETHRFWVFLQRIFGWFSFWGSFFVENTMDETSIHLVETSIFFVKIIWP